MVQVLNCIITNQKWHYGLAQKKKKEGQTVFYTEGKARGKDYEAREGGCGIQKIEKDSMGLEHWEQESGWEKKKKAAAARK